MIKDYCQATIQWEAKVLSGYGVAYSAAVSVPDIYVQRSIILSRGTDDTTSADALFIAYQNRAYGIGDKVTIDGRGYTITAVNEFYKPRSIVFDHLECLLKEVNNG